MNSHKKVSLYFHFPFCLKKCLYCGFHSVDGLHIPTDEYVNSLIREMRLCRAELEGPFSVPTLYFGGGTPSLMEPVHVERVIDEAAGLFTVAPDAEITIEANPGTVTAERLAGYGKCGANRLSLGVQSFNDSMLKRLGRVHTAAQALEALHAARSSGFANLGIDLICSLPGQSLSMWEDDLSSAVTLAPEHVSVYGLSIEEGTPFALMEKSGMLPLPEEEEAAAMLERTAHILRESGYERYEISNFARPGYRSRHNQAYWRRDSWLGFGSGAHSFLKEPGFGVRWQNPDDVGEYMRALGAGKPPWRERRFPTLREAMAEKLFLGLRMLDGIDLESFRHEFGVGFEEAYPHESSTLLSRGLVEISGRRLKLAERSLLVSNQIFVMFL